jgi:drug/metabolite transporter (DMT)-like permease
LLLNHAAAVMIVASGAVHAVVNAILKSGRDKMSSRALIDGFSAILMLPAIVLLPRPDGAWMWLAGSGITHLLYLICLVKAFEYGDMSAAYPISRGTAPVLAAVASVGLFGEPITIVVVGGGPSRLRGNAVHRARVSRRPALDLLGHGHRLHHRRLHGDRRARRARFAQSVQLHRLGVPDPRRGIGLIFALWRGPEFILSARSEWKAGLAAGALSIVTYGLALWAYRLGDVPRLAALRETAIVFGVGIAVLFLKERVMRARALGAATIAAGAVVLLALR